MTTHLISSKLTVWKFFKLSTTTQPRPLIGCSRAMIYVHYSNHINNRVKSYVGDESISIGWSKYIPNSSLGDLKKNLDVVGYVDTLNDMSTLLVCVIEQYSSDRGMTKHPRDFCKEILKLYQAKSTLLDLKISLIKSNTTMHKTSRWQMASTSMRNLTSHIPAEFLLVKNTGC